jgi:hypothetical protein
VAHAWNELRQVIDGAYRAYSETHETYALRGALRGFARNIEQRDRFEELFAEEWSNERRDRRMRGDQGRGPVKVGDAAKLLILHNVVRGIDAERMPASYDLFSMRESAHRAIVLGWLIGPHARAAHPGWLAETRSLPMYYQAMQVIKGDD